MGLGYFGLILPFMPTRANHFGGDDEISSLSILYSRFKVNTSNSIHDFTLF
jgi:hypothetical protein